MQPNLKDQLICFAGINNFHQIVPDDNVLNQNIISTPVFINFKSTSFLSYSVFSTHSILISSNGSAFASGSNSGHIINKSNVETYGTWTNINSNFKLTSAVCGSCYTIYAVDCHPSQLVVQWQGKNNGDSFYIKFPYSCIFGGDKTGAAIGNTELLLISQEMISQVPPLVEAIKPVRFNMKKLKPIQVACLDSCFIILNKDGCLYEYTYPNDKLPKQISNISNICHISGTSNHFLAVSRDGCIFVRGQNSYGQLGIGRDSDYENDFQKLKPFSNNKIIAAFAGRKHSLFLDKLGAVYACGSNENGELLFGDKSDKIVTSPLPTIIKQGATSCIAGNGISVVFIGQNPPNYCPNQGEYPVLPQIKRVSIIEAKLTNSKQENQTDEVKSEKKITDQQNSTIKEKSKEINTEQKKSLDDSVRSEIEQIMGIIQTQGELLEKLKKDNLKSIEMLDMLDSRILEFINEKSNNLKIDDDQDKDDDQDYDYDDF